MECDFFFNNVCERYIYSYQKIRSFCQLLENSGQKSYRLIIPSGAPVLKWNHFVSLSQNEWKHFQHQYFIVWVLSLWDLTAFKTPLPHCNKLCFWTVPRPHCFPASSGVHILYKMIHNRKLLRVRHLEKQSKCYCSEDLRQHSKAWTMMLGNFAKYIPIMPSLSWERKTPRKLSFGLKTLFTNGLID